jgi:hypothetical protein
MAVRKKYLIVAFLLIVFSLASLAVNRVAVAEKVGSSPESGSTSRLRTISDALGVLGFGSEGVGSWGDWGAMWNRIYSAAIWNAGAGDAVAGNVLDGKKFYAGANRDLLTGTLTYTGDAAVTDVVAGKTFYSNNVTKQTGTLALLDYSLQQYSSRDDYAGPNGGGGAEDYQGEEATWTSPVENVWKDGRTGLYWSSSQGNKLNQFTISDCDFFTTTPRSNYSGSDTGVGSAQCGPAEDAINYCATLNFGGYSDWYLPSQKELMQAYIDGMFNKAGTTQANAAAFTTTSDFWSSTEESSDATRAWYEGLRRGTTYSTTKSTGYAVRCVRRD